MKQTQNLLMTTMSTSLFNISESSPKKSQKKSRTPNMTPNRDLEKSRSMTFRSNSNFIDLFNSPSVSTFIRRSDTNLYERLHNQAKEKQDKIDQIKNEYLEQIKKEAFPKIQEVSRKIERKQELFPERLYPYHKLNKLDTEEDNSNSFEYAHVATVRSNPIGISGEFDNDDFRNNIDSIFCDDDEIKNLYGNKPSFVKIYRGIKHHKREKFPFRPMLTKNTDRIVKNMESAAVKFPLKKCKTIDDSNRAHQRNISSAQFKSDFRRVSDGDAKIPVERDRESYNAAATASESASPVKNINRFGSGNIINIDFVYANNECENSNYRSNNNNNNINNISSNMNSNNSFIKIKNTNNNNNNNPILSSAACARSNSAEIITFRNNDDENFAENNNNLNIALHPTPANNVTDISNNSKPITNKKATPCYFDNPTEIIKSRYEMELKKSYTSKYYNLNKQKSEKLNPNSIKISNKLYSQGINFMKKKEKLIDEKRKADLVEFKKHSFKPNLNSTSSSAFVNTNNNTNNVLNYNSITSSVNFASNNLSGFAQRNLNNSSNNEAFVGNNKPENNKNIGSGNINSKSSSNNRRRSSNNFVESSQSGLNNNSNRNNNIFKANNSKNSAFTHSTNKTASTNYTKINPSSAAAYAKHSSTTNNNRSSNKQIKHNSISNNSIKNNSKLNNKNDNVLPNKCNYNFYTSSKKIENFNYSCEEYQTPNSVNTHNQSNLNGNHTNNYSNNNNNSSISLVQTPARGDGSFSMSVRGSFYDRSKKWKEGKEQKAEKQREENTKVESGLCSFSPQIIPKSKNFFEEKFSNNNNNNSNLAKNDYVTRMLNSYSKKEQAKNFESKIFGENTKNMKMKITQPQEFNFSQLVSRKCRENLNKARVLHRAESVKNYREKLSTNIFFNEAVIEIEENVDVNSNVANADHCRQINNNIHSNTHNKSNDSNLVARGDGNRLIPEQSAQQLVNKNMNINLNVNIMMNK